MFWNKKQPHVDTDPQKIDELLNRGVITEILPQKQLFREKLLSGERLTFYIGADPTSTALHMSHAKNYMLLEEFRSLGHRAIVLFGDFTARIGDPTDRDTERKQLTSEEVKQNVSTWLDQITPLLHFTDPVNPAEIVYNSAWLQKITFEKIIHLTSRFTVQQMLERDMFKRRMKSGLPIYLHEFLYPLMQGYDSVALDTDVEIGGTDQTFNMLAGRMLLKQIRNKEKYVVIVNLMENPKTKELMSKSKGAGVFLDSSANDMYGSLMAQPDEMTKVFLVNNTRIPLQEIDMLEKKLSPKELKMRTAREIVSLFHGIPAAERAEKHFVETFSKGETPKDISEVSAQKGTLLGEVLVEEGIVPSKSEWRRLVEQGGIHNLDTGETIRDSHLKVQQTLTLKVGKRRFIKIVVA